MKKIESATLNHIQQFDRNWREKGAALRTAFNFYNMRGICEEKGLPRSTFNNHKMVETGEEKGLSRANFNYRLFCRNVGRKGAVSNHRCYHRMVRI